MAGGYKFAARPTVEKERERESTRTRVPPCAGSFTRDETETRVIRNARTITWDCYHDARCVSIDRSRIVTLLNPRSYISRNPDLTVRLPVELTDDLWRMDLLGGVARYPAGRGARRRTRTGVREK